MRKSIYLLTTTPSSHTHRFHPLPLATPTSCSPHPLATPASHTHTFHPLPTIVIHTLNLCKVQSMDDNCGEWVECMGVASGCGEQEVGVASGSGWNLWVWATGCGCKEVYRFTHTTYPYSSCICSFLQQHPYFLLKKKRFHSFSSTFL